MPLKPSLRSILFILISTSCVDRLSFDLSGSPTIIPVIVGFISDQPGPYQVTVSKSFDIEQDPKSITPLSVKSLTISDNTGVSEKLTEVSQGVYTTSASGIQGIAGSVYTLRIELLDGRTYESLADTLVNSGQLDSIYFNFVNQPDVNSTPNYSFDILFNSTTSIKSNFHFFWKFTGTFQAETNPELQKGCYMINGTCNFVPPCSGLRNVAHPAYPPEFERVGPCECCTCWYTIFNRSIFLSDDRLQHGGRFSGVKIYSLPLDAWIFTHKVHYKIEQFSVTRQTFKFWQAIRNQEEAVNSIFQPVNGKIPSNFLQLSGEEYPVAGIFYATSISSKSSYIYRYDVPNEQLIPNNKAIVERSCLELFPNATTVKPAFWKD